MNALPWTNIHAAFAHDAFALINVNELFWLDCLGEIVGIDLNELILVGPFWHWWVGVSLGHVESVFSHQRAAVRRGLYFNWFNRSTILPPLKQVNQETNKNSMNDHDDDVA